MFGCTAACVQVCACARVLAMLVNAFRATIPFRRLYAFRLIVQDVRPLVMSTTNEKRTKLTLQISAHCHSRLLRPLVSTNAVYKHDPHCVKQRKASRSQPGSPRHHPLPLSPVCATGGGPTAYEGIVGVESSGRSETAGHRDARGLSLVTAAEMGVGSGEWTKVRGRVGSMMYMAYVLGVLYFLCVVYARYMLRALYVLDVL